MANLTVSYLGLTLKNPIIVGSSGLTDKSASIRSLERNGAAAVVLKSLFEEEIILEKEAMLSRMQSGGFLYPETVDYYRYEDAPKETTADYLDLVRETKNQVSIPVLASINCMTAQQWTWFPKEIENAGADGLELNLFILPSDLNRSAEENEKVYFDIVQEVCSKVDIPVSLKISYYFSNLATMITRLGSTGIKGLVLFNRFYSPDIDIDNLQITSGSVLSTPGDLALSLRWIAIMAERVDCDLAASTGIHDGPAVIKQLLAGANAVQVVSAIYKHGGEKITEMLHQLETWMDKHDFASIDQFRGKMSQASTDNPAAFERVQFMKYFRGFTGEEI
ncbi:MAG: diguanylate cyclase [Bacteroides sp. SM1_62]|nr:MAG: diguanylate cyclase [Bacteroides sp. SM23_62]KPL25826.1 MAG: diguanylate cyclase [Bacteroides sp. SM1_62]